MSDNTQRADAARTQTGTTEPQYQIDEAEDYQTLAGCLTLGGLVVLSLVLMVVLIVLFGEPLH